MKIGIAVSGTGGHIYPGISIAQFLQKKGDDIVFFGNNSEITKKILEGYNYKLLKINICGWKNRNIVSLIKFISLFVFAFLRAIYFVIKYRLDVVIGMGGYLRIPVILAGKILGRKTIIQEQNYYPGLANKFLHIIADKTAVGFSESRKYFKYPEKVFFTGNPIRKEFYENYDKNFAKNYLKIPTEKKVVFIFGGSQGARFLNNLFLDFLDSICLTEYFTEDIFVIHLTGEKDFEEIKNKYESKNISALVLKYMPDIYMAYFASDLIISRAGASTITEIMVVERPAILIPYPYATDDHQTKNAMFLVENGCAKIYQENGFDRVKFSEDVKYFLDENNVSVINEKFEKNKNYQNLKFDENLYEIVKKQTTDGI
jgi:UDP-N-acetylglucosamine--N-acetylmuramyl-(pentapeptide) pyrophosphoryl-undecaprenol N-acetylglucosamine transferase